MLVLDQSEIDQATAAMCVAAKLPLRALESKDMREQVTAFILALAKNYEREEVHHGIWKDDNLTDIGAMVVHKGKRLQHIEDHLLGADGFNPMAHDQATDDALDAINYAAFAARLVHYSARDKGDVS